MRIYATAVLAILVALAPAATAAQAVSVDELLVQASPYVTDFVARFSSVVAEEDYNQRHVLERRTRRLRSDFLIVQIPGGTDWLSFRDVFEVDGKPATGRVMKTELRIEMGGTAVGAGMVMRNRSDIVTSFRLDERFGIAVPVEMRESHVFGSNDVVTVATYGRFRRFDVKTDETINPR